MATARTASSVEFDPKSEQLAPLLAGARARGMFDALEMMGQAAVLLDAEGRALAVTSRANMALGDALKLENRRLASVDPACDSSLQAALDAALDGRETRFAVSGRSCDVTLRIAPVSPLPGQLLAAVALLFPARDGLEKAPTARGDSYRRFAAAH